ncbi:hypothetical protein Rhe02_96610 [Rhizocola hellebori]|uniref:Activator of Hsp90 ATPase homologue 1/2-like C-terminal domain-containing protein n=1 Tax=Rhizocola hellebori TaxID=1392758 RepID=A0A8J3QI85_9ACTN|nr:SRPBCC domain-containing protein [Rhizocola hellebori]GIH11594.1 hypothetical protein Rhe02_96610 [Rhizocola hellebori]
MSDKSFTTTFVVDQTPQAAFAAINNVREWWSEDVEGPTDHLDAEFSYSYLDVHRCHMKIVEFVPDEKVVWHCIDNYFSFTKDETEWVDTKLVFEISKHGDQTQIRFTHVGLVPEYECFDVCTNAWSGYVGESLKTLITTGSGARNNEARNAEAQAQYK